MVSVILASYQGAAYIREQIDSILAQSIPLRLIISDDGSTDGTTEILQAVEREDPERVCLMPHQKSEGSSLPPAAANFFWLLAHVEDDYILFSDQDDLWETDKAEVLLADLQEAETRLGKDCPLLVYSDMKVIDADGKVLGESFMRYQGIDPSRTELAQILVENPVTGGAMMINRALMRLLSQAPEVCVMHDWWAALTAAAFGRILYEARPLSCYRQHDHNTLGAARTGSAGEVKKRLTAEGKKRAAEGYRQIFAQAAAFRRHYDRFLTAEQKQILAACCRLPQETPPVRLLAIGRYGFTKSAPLLTLSQCLTIPKPLKEKGAEVRKAHEGTQPTGNPSGKKASGENGGPAVMKETGRQKETGKRKEAGKQVRVNCVILNYRDPDSVLALAARLKQDPQLYHIILVDNASGDDSAKKLETATDERTILLQAGRNGGYGAGNDLGIRYSMEQDQAEYVIVANPDVEFTSFTVNRLLTLMERHPELGAAAPAILDEAYPEMKNAWPLRSVTGELLSMGPVTRRLFARRLQYPDAYYRRKDGRSKTAVYTDCLHGSLLMLRSRAYRECGGYDPGIFLYEEEAVLGYRLREAGWRSALLLNCSYRHHHSVSISASFGQAEKRQLLREESTLYYLKQYLHMTPLQERLAKLWFALLIAEIRVWEKVSAVRRLPWGKQ